MKKAYFIIFILIYCNSELFSQKTKFGKVSREELEMTVYPHDSSATAVILYDKGSFDDNDLKFSRHIRIKILKKAGLEWGNWTFNTPSKVDFRVEVFNLEDGEINRSKADKNTIYEEEVVDKFSVYKVFAPNVKVGSVIDISYFHYGIPLEWRFQERIPVKYSELHISPSNFLDYNKAFFGFEHIDQVSPFIWKAENMPAFKMEPYLSSYTNYITKFEFNIVRIGGPLYRIDRRFSTSWEIVNQNLLESSRFGTVIKSCSFLNKYAKELNARNLSTEEKINKAFDYIQDNIKWNGQNSAISSISYRNSFTEDHSGNSADINLMLIALLRKLDIQVFPVVLSTRDNGILVKHTPNITKLNYVVAYVNQDDIELLIDATSEKLIPGVLPEKCLNLEGLIVEEGQIYQNETARWVPLNIGHQLTKKQFFTINVTEDEPCQTTLTQMNEDYGYLRWRERYGVKDEDENYLKAQIDERYPEVVVLDYKIDSRDETKLRLTEVMELDIKDKILDVGNELLFNPSILFEFNQNPFKSSDRKYPVDLSYPTNYTTIITLRLPQSYNPTTLPPPIKLVSTDNSAQFTYVAGKSSQGIQIKYTLAFNKAIFSEMEYLELRTFMTMILEKISTPIEILKGT